MHIYIHTHSILSKDQSYGLVTYAGPLSTNLSGLHIEWDYKRPFESYREITTT